MRKLAKMLAATLAAMLAVPKYVLESGKWVLKSLFAPPIPEGAEVEDAMDAVAVKASAPVTPSQAAQPTRDGVTPSPTPDPAPTPLPAKIVELDPVLARGKLAYRFVDATFTLEPEENILKECDDVLRAWLLSLNAQEMMAIHRAGAHRTAAHLAGKRLIEDLPEIATDAEFRHTMGQAARMTQQRRDEIAEWNATLAAAIDEMVSDPAYELKCGI